MIKVAIKSMIVKTLWRVLEVAAKDVAPENFKGLGCVIAPHPDDETLGCGATVIRAGKAGNNIKIIVLTDGSSSEEKGDLTHEELAIKREAEMLKAGMVLGIPSANITFLRFRDGVVDSNEEQLKEKLTQQLAAIAPNYILSPSPIDSHPNHRAGGRALRKLMATGIVSCPVYEYIVWFSMKDYFCRMLPLVFSGNLRRVATKNVQTQKAEAFKAHATQSGGKNADAFRKAFWSRYFRPYEIFIENMPTAAGK